MEADAILYGEVSSGLGPCNYLPFTPRATGKRVNLLERLMQVTFDLGDDPHVRTHYTTDRVHTRLQTTIALPSVGKNPHLVMKTPVYELSGEPSSLQVDEVYAQQLKELHSAAVRILMREDDLDSDTAERYLSEYVRGFQTN